MHTEFEIKFTNVHHAELTDKLRALSGTQIMPRTFMKRAIFRHPDDPNAYLRIRDEGQKVTCTFKRVATGELNIHSVRELECEVSDFDTLKAIFTEMKIAQKSYQETYRETWTIGEEIYFMLDEWPGLAPFVEIEWANEAVVRSYAERLGFAYEDGLFGTIDQLYWKTLCIEPNTLNAMPEITFQNPPKRQL